MTKQPESLRVAEVLASSPNYSGTPIWEAVDLLRRQHKAIVKLREALTELSGMYVVHHNAATRAKQALKDTEGL